MALGKCSAKRMGRRIAISIWYNIQIFDFGLITVSFCLGFLGGKVIRPLDRND